MRSSRGRSLSRGKIHRSDAPARNRVCTASFATEISRFPGAVQRFFGTDWIGEEPGVVPGSDTAELLESRKTRVSGRSDLSPSVVARHAPQRPACLSNADSGSGY